ncbi:MAG: UDP-3-O-(3-hydroxymyristoyl)glucosamine N-acyltransferase, partial [Woeseia sp.]
MVSLGELATQFSCELIGDADVVVDNVASLDKANAASLSFLANRRLKHLLTATNAAAVILRAEDAEDCATAALITENPYASYAQMAALICPAPSYAPGVHASAVVAPTATVAPTAHIAANAVIEDRAKIGERVYIGPGSVVGPDCTIGAASRLLANVTIVRKVAIGQRCILHPGVIIGADGFGNAMTPAGWVKVPQLGGVRIGDDVEIGANSTIDCGAIDDTVIEDGVRIDNLVMIGHNSRVGAHTALAAQSALAGSTTVGKRCLFAGQSGSVGHVSICDDVTISGRCAVSKDIDVPGVYSSSFFPAEPIREWNRQIGRFRRLDKLI